MKLLEKAKKDNVKFVQLQFSDIHGMIKTVTIPVEKLKNSLKHGTWFDGSSIEGFTRICESDMYLKPDTETYTLLPWENEGRPTARIICDVFTPDGKPFEGDPRYILKKALKKAKDRGYIFNVGPELEFFLFRTYDGKISLDPHDKATYFDFAPRDLAGDVKKEIIYTLEKLGLDIEMSHHEVAPGQHEIDFKYGEALSQADKAITFKHAVKSIAKKNGLHAAFMPKPIFGENGSGMHVHQSLYNSVGKNIFYDKKDDYCLSKTAKHFIAGQLKHIKSICAITSPTVNSYKRLVPGYEAPVYICWAQKNRSSLIRIPRIPPGRQSAARAELRCPDTSSNPYLAFAAMLHTGLDGIKKKMKPPKPVEENVYDFNRDQRMKNKIDKLPVSLGEAIRELKKSDICKEILGEHSYLVYINAKEKEWREYSMQVTKWEIDKYLEVI